MTAISQTTDSRDIADRPPLVTVVLPCLNEVESVGVCVEQAKAALASAGLPGEVVVVDNGSSDGSPEAAAAHGARVIREPARGYGRALRTGIAVARGDVVVMADADCTYDLSRVDEMVQPVLAGDADLVLGSRLEAATGRSMPLLHRFVGTPVISSLIGRACGHKPAEDSQSGYRAFRRDAVVALGLRCDGMEFASEMLIRGVHEGLRIREIPMGYAARVGESKLETFSDGWRHLRLILALSPHLLLFVPGVATAVAGIGLTGLSFLRPSGIPLGSLNWQPIFFSTILVVLGVLAAFAGAVLAHRSPFVSQRVRDRFAFVGHDRFPRRCSSAGLVALGTGLAQDLALFWLWVSGHPSPHFGPALAALAQGLILMGATLAVFGFVYRVLDEAGRPCVTLVLPNDEVLRHNPASRGGTR